MLEHINGILSGILVPTVLILAGLFYAFRLRCFHLTRPRAVLRGLRSDGTSGGISSGKAVTLALAGTLGVGNIVGVSSAIYMGGFGAVFWMWISALVAMLLKYAEIVLAMRHRRTDGDGKPLGSAMYYITDFFGSLGFRRLGRAVATVFAAVFLLNALTMGSMLQANAISGALDGVMGISPAVSGAALCLFTLFCIKKGTGGIIKATNFLVPLMSAGFIVISAAVIARNFSTLDDAFRLIFSSAFCFDAALGGVGGFAFMRAVRYGVMRGLVSNEAGCGTAPTAHALASCQSPARQGMWGIFEVFADTILLCTLTALCVILEYGAALEHGGNYMMMTVSAYASALGNSASVFICVAVLCFGVATVICWAHYGSVCVSFLCGSVTAKKIFVFIYSLCVLGGALVSSELAWQLSDFAMGIMTLINLSVIVFMWREVKEETELYLKSK